MFEEAGIDVAKAALLGERTHPTTGRCAFYVDVHPVTQKSANAADEEVPELRWVTLDELDALLPELFEPARTWIVATLAERARDQRE